MDYVVQILQAGVIGLGFLLAVLASVRLEREQRRKEVRPLAVSGIKWFMAFSVTLCLIGLAAQIWSPRPPQHIDFYWESVGRGDYGDMDILQETKENTPATGPG